MAPFLHPTTSTWVHTRSCSDNAHCLIQPSFWSQLPVKFYDCILCGFVERRKFVRTDILQGTTLQLLRTNSVFYFSTTIGPHFFHDDKHTHTHTHKVKTLPANTVMTDKKTNILVTSKSAVKWCQAWKIPTTTGWHSFHTYDISYCPSLFTDIHDP